MRTFFKVALAVAAVSAVAVLISAQTREAPKEPPSKSEDQRFVVKITDEMVRHSRIQHSLYFIGTFWSLGVLALLHFSGAARRMRDASARAAKRPFVASMLFIAMLILAVTVLELPLTIYSDYIVPHQFDLSNQTFASWLVDGLKGLAVGLVLGTTVGAGALLIVRKVNRWWLALWAASIPFVLFMAVIQPVVLDPIFNKFEPLQNAQLRQKLLDLASRAGIEGGRVYQVNKSKQTKTMNAYVNGIGPTNRIVMWDTLLAKMNDDEVLAVMGHEMGHYVMKHMWKGVAFGLGVSFIVLFLVQRIHDRILPRHPELGERGDPATIPLLLLIAGVLGFLSTPIIAAYSRSMEHDADKFSLELTHL
ncbi:MAG TPA: M48 family metallopeptidase, partial [Thermoanaerobaculia bacterium]|nr:M48 family metallopeptidase [Thermoanaerobaculia bacterium]